MSCPSETEEFDEFVRRVKEMRAAQRLYFKTRTPSALSSAKALEKEVDHLVEDWWTVSA